MKHLLITLLATITGIGTFAQNNNGKITGSIQDGGNQKIIDAATVSLLKAKDSSIIKVALTDEEGNFIFEQVNDGNYLLEASSIGHSKVYSAPFVMSAAQSSHYAGILHLVPVNKNLKEVILTSRKQFIERKIDRTIINVDAAISNEGSTALDVLEKSPGVNVDKDGNVSLRGKQGVLIMLDGKPSYLTGADLTNLLRTMPSNMLDQIEIMTNPSAKYDAAGNSGIINIKTKKNKQRGFNGSLNLNYGQGVFAKTDNSLNLNYKNGKFNVFANFGANYRENFQDLNIKRIYKNSDKTVNAIFEQKSNEKRFNNNYNTKIGIDFYADKKTTVGVVFTGFTTPGSQVGYNLSYLKSNAGVVDSIVSADRYEKSKWKKWCCKFEFPSPV